MPSKMVDLKFPDRKINKSSSFCHTTSLSRPAVPLFLKRVSAFLIEHFPVIKQATIEALDAVFAPKAVARQLALAVALQTGAVRR